MPASRLLSRADLDEIGHAGFDADDPSGTVAELVEAVDRGRVGDPADTGYALLIAAEIAERDGDLPAALDLADRAVAAYRAHGDPDCGFPRAFRAQLLHRLGRAEEAMAELTALRPLLSQDTDAVYYVTDALESGGHAETAVAWLTVALGTALAQRAALAPHRPEPGYGDAAVIAYALAQQRHRLRRSLDLPRDDYDDLADRLRQALDDTLHAAAEHSEPEPRAGTAVLYWPREQYDRLLRRWPALADAYGQTWDEHRTQLERGLALYAESGHTQLALLPGAADGLAAHAAAHGGDPTDPAIRQAYVEHLNSGAHETAWPPGRNEPCWCGTGQKYKRCCLPRART